jgi:hypothetical protein
LSPAAGGSTCGGVLRAAISGVVTTHWASTRRRTRTPRTTQLSAASNRAKIGFGTTEPTSTWKGLTSPLRSIIRSTSLCPDHLDGSLPTGRTFWRNHEVSMVRERLRRSRGRRDTDHRTAGAGPKRPTRLGTEQGEFAGCLLAPARCEVRSDSRGGSVQSECRTGWMGGQSAGHQSPCGSVVCPTSMMYPSGSRM